MDTESWIVDDYIELENSFAGISKSNGVEFGLGRISANSNDILGYVRYIMPNSDATDKDIRRGDIFLTVNGTQLTIENYRELLFSDLDTYTLDLANIENGTIVPNGRSVELTKFEYTENPVLIAKTFVEAGKKIGYLLYNSFDFPFDDDMNDAFLQFKNESVTDLIVDLRYNRGGRGSSALALAGMITGQFKGEVFQRDQYNPKIQAELEESNPDWLVEKFTDRLANGNRINSLNLNSVHFIVTDGSASASELTISALQPYIDVTIVGDVTYGKYTGSLTLYDSDDYRREGANPDHLYAMQPLILEYTNSLGQTVRGGMQPDIERIERISNMGILGERNEPLLSVAINDILGVTAKFEEDKFPKLEMVGHSKSFYPMTENLIIEKPGLRKVLNEISQGNK